MPVNIADVIEHHGVGLAWRRPEHAPHLLQVEAKGLCGAQQDGAACCGDIEPFAYHVHSDKHLQLTCSKARHGGITPERIGAAQQCGGLDPGMVERCADMLGVLDVAAESDRALPSSKALVVRDCVTRHGGPIHALGGFVDGVITSAAMQSRKIRNRWWCVKARRAKEAASDQLGGRWPEHQTIKHRLEAAAILADRGCCDTEAQCLWPMGERLAPCAGSGVVGLVDHDEIGLRGDAVKAPRERLHRCDLYGCICCRAAGSDDAVRHIGQAELGAGLRDQLTAMDQHDGASAACCDALQHGGDDYGLAGAGRSDQQRRACAIAECGTEIGDRLLLVWAKLQRVVSAGIML